jgi:hypothetical protein
MPQAASGRRGGRTEPEEAAPVMPCGGRKEYVMDYYMAEIELVEWHRRTRERSARASILARARQEETEAEMLQQSQTQAPARAQCRCWHCAASSPNA